MTNEERTTLEAAVAEECERIAAKHERGEKLTHDERGLLAARLNGSMRVAEQTRDAVANVVCFALQRALATTLSRHDLPDDVLARLDHWDDETQRLDAARAARAKL